MTAYSTSAPRPRVRAVIAVLASLMLSVSASAAAATGEPMAVPADPDHQQVALQPAGAAQSGEEQSATTAASEDDIPVQVASATVEQEVAVVGVTWAEATRPTVRLRARTGATWSSWRTVEVSPAERGSGTEGDAVIGVQEVQVEVTGEVGDAVLEVWGSDPEASDLESYPRVDGLGVGSTEAIDPDAVVTHTVNGPVIATRAQWGADESVRKWSPNYIESTKGITIHHTAGTNDYTADQVPAIIRGMYRYHAVSLDWGDIGYNIMVDKFGRAWEGRRGGVDTSLRTAQAYGMNYTTAGISLLGNYDVRGVTTAGFEAMAAVTAWKLDAHGLDVNSTFRHTNDYEGWTRTLPTVHMHRDVNKTSCPGRYFAGRFDEFRSRVAAYQSRNLTAVQRVGGVDRYDTAAQLAETAHPRGAETVYLVNGGAIPDVLLAGATAARNDDAVLLTTRDVLPEVTKRRIIELAPTRIVIVGGDSAVSTVQGGALHNMGYEVSRIAGPSRYAHSVMLSQAWEQSDTVFLASAREPADALSGASAAAHLDAPLLMADGSALTQGVAEELVRLAPKRVVLLGGEVRIGADVVDQIRGLLPEADVDRLWGEDRYQTSARLVANIFDTSSPVLLANGLASVDAVAATQFADFRDAPVLLVTKRCQPGIVRTAINRLETNLHILLGGPRVLDTAAATTRC